MNNKKSLKDLFRKVKPEYLMIAAAVIIVLILFGSSFVKTQTEKDYDVNDYVDMLETKTLRSAFGTRRRRQSKSYYFGKKRYAQRNSNRKTGRRDRRPNDRNARGYIGQAAYSRRDISRNMRRDYNG